MPDEFARTPWPVRATPRRDLASARPAGAPASHAGAAIAAARSTGDAVVVYDERPSSVERTTVWRRRGPLDTVRVDPDGCMDLIWTGSTLIVAGPDTRSHPAAVADGGAELPTDEHELVGLRFSSGVGPVVLGVPASELRDLTVPLDAVWPSADVRMLVDRLAESGDRSAELETIANDRIARHGPPDAFAAAVAASLRSGMPVAAVAATVSYSERQLRRRCLDAFGYGPKTLARVLRFRRALDLAGREPSFATVAALAGYADQAHLAREVKAIAGVPLSQLVE